MEWFTSGVIIAQSFLLFFMGYMAMNTIRSRKRDIATLDEQQDLFKQQVNIMFYQHGIIAALQSEVIGPWALRSIDFSNLPIEIRLKILYALIDVGVTCRHQSEATT